MYGFLCLHVSLSLHYDPWGAGVKVLTCMLENAAGRVVLNSQVSYVPESYCLLWTQPHRDHLRGPPQILFVMLTSPGSVPGSGSFPLLLLLHFTFTRPLDSET